MATGPMFVATIEKMKSVAQSKRPCSLGADFLPVCILFLPDTHLFLLGYTPALCYLPGNCGQTPWCLTTGGDTGYLTAHTRIHTRCMQIFVRQYTRHTKICLGYALEKRLPWGLTLALIHRPIECTHSASRTPSIRPVESTSSDERQDRAVAPALPAPGSQAARQTSRDAPCGTEPHRSLR